MGIQCMHINRARARHAYIESIMRFVETAHIKYDSNTASIQ